MTKVALSRVLNLSSNAITALEGENSLPQVETISRIVAATGFPREFFFRPVKWTVQGPVYWRVQRSDAVRSKNKTSQRISWALEAESELSHLVVLPELNLPDVSRFPSHWTRWTDEQIELLAEQCRAEWGLGEHPIPDATLALENIGIPVLAFDIESPKQSGFMHWHPDFSRPIVGTNTLETSWSRLRFNVFHELGHVLMHHRSATETELRTPALYRQIENQAHRFAAAILFPRNAFLRRVRYCSLEEFAAHKQEWGLSIMAQITRAKQLQICSDDLAQSLMMRASKRGFRRPLGEPFDETHQLEKPRMFKRSVDAVEAGNPLLFARLQTTFPLPREDQISIFGRTLQLTGDNVVQLRPKQDA